MPTGPGTAEEERTADTAMSIVARLPHEVSSVRMARRIVREVAAENGALADDAALLTTELATNVILHTNSPILLRIRVDEDEIRVAFTDESGALPIEIMATNADPHGRGILIVDSVAHRWGVRRRRNGKTIWFALDRRPQAPTEPTGDAHSSS